MICTSVGVIRQAVAIVTKLCSTFFPILQKGLKFEMPMPITVQEIAFFQDFARSTLVLIVFFVLSGILRRYYRLKKSCYG